MVLRIDGKRLAAVVGVMWPIGVLGFWRLDRRQVIQRSPDSAAARALSPSARLSAPWMFSVAMEYMAIPRVLNNTRKSMAIRAVAPRRVPRCPRARRGCRVIGVAIVVGPT